jgi:hypothetical protein
MGWSLEVEAAANRFPDENLQFLRDIGHLAYTPTAAQLTSNLAQHLRLEVREEDMSTDLERDLRGRGFIRIASTARMLLDLAPFDAFDPFLASCGRKHRHHLRQSEARFREAGGVVKLLPVGEIEPRYLDELYLKVVLPACSALGVNPFFRVATREGFTQMLSTGGAADLFVLILEMKGTPVAAAILTIVEGIPEGERIPAGTVRSWVREVSDAERTLEFLIAHGDPVVEGNHDVSSLLYSRSIQFAIETGCTLWSGGQESGTCAGKYLGVRAAKRRWGAVPFLVFSPPHMFLRLSQQKCLRDNLDIETSDRSELAAAQVFVMVNRSERNRLLLARAAKSLPLHVITLSERDADYWRNELEKHGKDTVTVEAFPPI